MRRRALRFAHACLTSILGHNTVSLSCCNKLPFSHSALRLFATPRTPSTAGQRHAQARNLPYLTADVFGRPSLVHPAANPHQHERDEAMAPGQPEKGVGGVHQGRQSRLPRKARLASSGEIAINDAQSPSANGSSWSGRRSARSSETTAMEGTGAGSPEESQQGDYEAYPQSEVRSSQLKFSDRQLRTHDQALRPAGPGAGPGKAALHEAESLDRRLTYRLLKADSLQDLEKLLSDHTGVTNVIHLAAAARQAVLLGSLSRPQETRRLLDKYLEHWEEATTGLQKEQRPQQPANPQAPTIWVASSATSELGRSQHVAALSDGQPKPGNSEAGWRHGRRRQGRADATSGSATLADRKLSAEEAAPASSAMEGAAAPASTARASVVPNPAAVLPLRELSDVLWAYGKLRCKPPERLWSRRLRPMLLDPGALIRLQEGDVREGGNKQRPASSRRRAAQSAPSPEGDAESQTGQTLSKLAVALARMREEDVEVWRALARAAAAMAPAMCPRALTSLLWAFGSARMTHGRLLLAAVQTIRLELPRLNGQDLACAMWALARLAPPPLLLPLACDASGSASAAAVARAAAATATARDLLYGDLSDAVRRRMQLQGLKPAEITTLLGALDEMAQHQQHPHLHPAHAPPHGGSHEHVEGLPSNTLAGPHASALLGGGRTLQASPRLLRVVSQAVRKNLSLLPVGALAEAAAAFQRLGHHDASFFRALAAGMMARLRHLEPWHLVRAAVALQTVGYVDGAFFAKVLEAAQRDLISYKTWEVLALVDVCGQLAAPNSTADDSSWPSPGTTADGTSGSGPGPGPVVLDPAVARAFMHSVVLHAVSSVGATPSSRRVDRRRTGAAESGGRDEAGGVAALRVVMGPEPLRLRHWNRLLRAAAAAGWHDEGLADRALDGMLLELHGLRGPWLATVRSRCVEVQGRPLGRDSGLHDQHSRLLSGHQQGKGEAEADGDAGRKSLPGANSSGLTAAPSYDFTAGDIAGAVRTAAVLGQRRRVDVVAAAVSLLLEASNVAVPAAATAIAEGAATAESYAAGRRPIGAGRAFVAMEQQLSLAPSAARVGGGLFALSPKAVRELAAGLDYFEPELEPLAYRRTKAAVQLLRQRVGVPSAGNSV